MNRLVLAFFAVALAACASPLEIGEECTDSADCVDGASCFFTDGTMMTSRCMADCPVSTTRLCENGEVCIPASGMDRDPDNGVCFLGGSGIVGTACVDTFDCTRGTLCVAVGDEQSCFRACTTDDDSTCQAGETCEALVGMGTDGYCAPTP